MNVIQKIEEITFERKLSSDFVKTTTTNGLSQIKFSLNSAIELNKVVEGYDARDQLKVIKGWVESLLRDLDLGYSELREHDAALSALNSIK